VVVFSLIPSAIFAEGQGDSSSVPAIWSVIPFVLMLLSIAILPVTIEHWWHSNGNKLIVAIGLSLPVAAYMIYIGRYHDLEHQMVMDYIPFITLLAALFYISGGIVLRGDIPATPLNNTMFLSIGSVLASVIGTTGASMLLIRPLLKSNSERKNVVHTVIFFIFLVSNIGGLLTPLGDPPLFLGYLKGVPFTWTFNLTGEWLFAVVTLLIIYYAWDFRAYKSETGANIVKDETYEQPISLRGHVNFFWLMGVVFVVAFVNENYEPFRGLIERNELFRLTQVPLLMLLMILSKLTTKREYRAENSFTFYPIQEVAYLFIGIFITMVPALILLRENGHALGITEPFQYFIGTGIFSSFLDNAPTYLVFLSLAQGTESIAYVLETMPLELAAISMGAVFWGAVTYIGNAPNFMVKSIAEENRVRMPGFGRYMVYSVLILIPVFTMVLLIFLI
jgi:Na+/H+ antiporter NhaD/arsenite permease-like protein